MTDLPRDDLPIWMQKTLRRTDWGVLIVLLFSLLAAWPFLLQPGLPRASPSENYVYRAADTAAAFAEGRLYPRWSPNALGGYGAPIPHFYPPGAAYIPALITFFVTGDATAAVKLVYTLSLILAGTSVYAFVTRRSGAAAGVAAALLYVYSPYMALTAPHLLGDLPGVISLALIPALLWSTDRLLRANRPLDLVYLALITAALFLTDVPAALVGGLLASALVLYSRPPRSDYYRALSAGVLGIGVAACYWLPALVEADAVQWFARPLEIPHLLTASALFTPLRPLDPAALVHLPQFTLGLALPLAALASLPMILRRVGYQRLFLALAVALIAFALTVMQPEVWLLGLITLCLSIAATAVVQWNSSRLFLPILSALILAAAAPVWLAPRWSEASIDTSPLAQIVYEQQGFGIAALPPGDVLPSLVAPTLSTNRALIASYREGLVSKVEQNASVQVGVLEHSTHEDRLQVQTFAPLTLSVLTADFPGWSAYFNDSPLPTSHNEDGLIRIIFSDVERGELAITLGSTTPRAFAWLVVWAALLLLVVITVRRSRKASSDQFQPLDLLTTGQVRLLAVLLVGFAVMLALVALPSAPLAAQLPRTHALVDSILLDNHTDAGLQLLAYDLKRTSYLPGDTIDLTLFWRTEQLLSENYQVRLSLLDQTTGAFRQRTVLHEPGSLSTLRWMPSFYVPDPYSIPLSLTIPAGTYSPAVEVCTSTCALQSRLTFLRDDGGSYGQTLVLPIILTVS
ncbi:MAG: 6-pyruvoyl-tetrahydropterin synthase-related protein [Chloroflexota bacterium]